MVRIGKLVIFLILILTLMLIVKENPISTDNYRIKRFELESKSIDVASGVRPVSFEKGAETNLFSEVEFSVPFDGYISAFNPQPINAPKDSLRYTFAYKLGEADPICPEKPRIVHVMSVEYNDMSYSSKFGYGYPVKKGEKILISSAFANFGTKDQYDTRTKVTIEMIKAAENLIPITPVFLNIIPCTSLFFIPPGAKDFEKTMEVDYEVPFDSKIILAGSHAHNFADEITLLKNGKPIWVAKPAVNDKGLNGGNPVYINLGGFGYVNEGLQLKKGDKLNLKVKYTNPNAKEIDGMGSMLIFLRPDDGSANIINLHH